jgi:hypothetical protein
MANCAQVPLLASYPQEGLPRCQTASAVRIAAGPTDELRDRPAECGESVQRRVNAGSPPVEDVSAEHVAMAQKLVQARPARRRAFANSPGRAETSREPRRIDRGRLHRRAL